MQDLTFLDFSIRNGGIIAEANLKLRDQGLVLLRGENLDSGGSNRSGKSTLFDALSYTVIGSGGKGRTESRAGISKNDFLPLRGGGNVEFVLRFIHKDDEYEIGNYRKHKPYGTSIRITKNGEYQEHTIAIGDMQKEVLKCHGLSEREWFGSVYLTQNHSHTLVSGTPKQKHEHVAAHFGLDDVAKCITINSKWIGAIQLPDEDSLRELLGTCDEQLNALPAAGVLAANRVHLQSEVRELSTKLINIGVEIRGYEAARGMEEQRKLIARSLLPYNHVLPEVTRLLVDSIRTKIQLGTAAAQVLKTRDSLQAQLLTLEDTPDPTVIQSQVADIQTTTTTLADLSSKLERRHKLETTLSGIEAPEATMDDMTTDITMFRRKLASLEAEARSANAELDKLRKLQDKCPTCMRTVEPHEKEQWVLDRQKVVDLFNANGPRIQSTVASLEKEMKASEDRTRIEADLSGLPMGDWELTKQQYNELRTQAVTLTNQMATAMTRKRLLDQLSSIHEPEGVEYIVEIPSLTAELQVVSTAYEFLLKAGTARFSDDVLVLAQQTQTDIHNLHSKISEDLALVMSQEQSRKQFEAQKQDIESKLKRHSAEKQRKCVLEVMNVVLKDVKAKALRDCTEMLKGVLPLYVKQLFPCGNVSVELSQDEDSLDFYLRDGQSQLPMSLLCGGEAKRIGLAVLFAFAKLGAKTTNILIADEPYKDLDQIGRECAFELFSDLGIPSVFVTSHDQDQLQTSKYDKTLIMRRQNGVSRLIEE